MGFSWQGCSLHLFKLHIIHLYLCKQGSFFMWHARSGLHASAASSGANGEAVMQHQDNIQTVTAGGLHREGGGRGGWGGEHAPTLPPSPRIPSSLLTCTPSTTSRTLFIACYATWVCAMCHRLVKYLSGSLCKRGVAGGCHSPVPRPHPTPPPAKLHLIFLPCALGEYPYVTANPCYLSAVPAWVHGRCRVCLIILNCDASSYLKLPERWDALLFLQEKKKHDQKCVRCLASCCHRFHSGTLWLKSNLAHQTEIPRMLCGARRSGRAGMQSVRIPIDHAHQGAVSSCRGRGGRSEEWKGDSSAELCCSSRCSTQQAVSGM